VTCDITAPESKSPPRYINTLTFHTACFAGTTDDRRAKTSRGAMRPRLCVNFRATGIRGRGECRMRAAPAVPCAKWIEETHTSIQVQRRTSDIPCAMALRLITRSPRRRIRLVTVIGELTEYPRPVGPTLLRRFDTSNGCQNHTTSPYAATSFVCALLIAHGSGSIQNPPCHHVSRLTLPRPPRPAPRL
jgi:hypothetical protein